jgi:hypothetical protein
MNCTVAGEAVQNSQHVIIFTLQLQGDTFKDTQTIVPLSARLPENSDDFMPPQTILKCRNEDKHRRSTTFILPTDSHSSISSIV